MGVNTRERRQIARNARAFRGRADLYESVHDEIFNPVEQRRLRDALARACRNVTTAPDRPMRALDFGCGSGNLTRHLLELGCEVVAADVAPQFLSLVEKQHPAERPLRTFRLNGRDLHPLRDGEFDLVATYSVLHHIPDYLGAVSELVRVLRPGGVLVIDHEHNDEFWTANPPYATFQDEVRRARPAPEKHWRRFLDLRRYLILAHWSTVLLRQRIQPRYEPEGDIHIWPDDHIEWEEIERVVTGRGCELIAREDYLLYRASYTPEIYQRYAGSLTDCRILIARRRGAADR